MRHIIYADIAFLLNFCMDFLALFAAGRVLGLKISAIRLALSSAFGSLYSISTFFFSYSVVPDIVLNVAVSVVMCFIAYKISGLASFTKVFLIFYLACFMLGGGVEALYYMSGVISENLGTGTEGIQLSAGELIILSGICVLIFIAAMKIMRHYAKERKAKVIIGFNGKECAVDVLVDSGNMLTDPISSLPVLVINIKSLMNLFDSKMIEIFLNDRDLSSVFNSDTSDIETIRRLKFRVIPVKTINESSIMPAFIPDYIKLKSKSRLAKKDRLHDINAIIAVDGKTKNTYGTDCCGIIPQVLIDF